MLRRLYLLTIVLLCLIPQKGFAQKWVFPSLPSPSPEEKAIMIFATKGPPNISEIKTVLNQYPSSSLRMIFTQTFEGFSVSGKRKELLQLARMYQPRYSMFENSIYTVDAEVSSPLEIIGAKNAASYTDSKGHRLTGKGIRIGVIDTGIDYTHPDLKANYGGGFDLVDNDNNPMETLDHQGKPTIHGTHVAGIIAANGQMKGVAPEAKIFAYRALGAGGSGTTEQVLSAIERAVKDKMDIINLSLGSNVNGPDLPISLALNKVVEEGIVAVTSNGNSGPHMWTVGTPGTSSNAISVGASTPTLRIPFLTTIRSNKPIKITSLVGSKMWSLDRSYLIEEVGLGNKEEMKQLQGKIALIQRGGMTFTEKAKNAEKAGAVGVLIYNNTKGNFMGKIEGSLSIPVGAISKKDGESLIKQVNKTKILAKTIYKEEKDLLADFSSRGPVTSNWSIKPDIIAPGVSIKSTVPNNRYLALQGTSMAAPYIAGAAALIKQAHPKWTPTEIKAALMNTATPLYNNGGARYKVFEQGAGRVNIDKAIHTDTLVIPGSLSFGLLTNQFDERRKEVVVQNMSQTTKQYRFRIPPNNLYVDWKLPLSFELKPGEKKKISINAFIKREFENRNEIMEGELLLLEANEEIKIPYIFIKEEPSYPRLMGLTIVQGDRPNTYRYEVYLPMGADEFGMALFDPKTLDFKGYLDVGNNISPGIKENQITIPNQEGVRQLVVVAFARKNGFEDKISQTLKFKTDLDGKK
ncbi:S8 family serine peptidase [Heyndrickxia oleronia]|uniref:S8 family serine peptidase n=1 Tax=Heyndrickxia oleronia TaxID=38875 RepID=UPI00203FA7C2|nr:S8 family serine peptidase [Heyndrickxia oleronia]MCM3456360.1 S8 family serine peptidase [Heyndrickxia oleronia]